MNNVFDIHAGTSNWILEQTDRHRHANIAVFATERNHMLIQMPIIEKVWNKIHHNNFEPVPETAFDCPGLFPDKFL